MGARCGISRFVKRLVVATCAVGLAASALTGQAMAELGLPSPVGAGNEAQQSAAAGVTVPAQLSAPVAAVAQTAADVSDPVADAASAVVHPSDTADAVAAATGPVTQASASSVQPVTAAAASVTVPVSQAASPVTASAAPVVAGATKRITSVAAPLVTELTKPLAPLAAAASEVTQPLLESTEPLLAPVAPLLAPTLAELTEPLAPVTKTLLPVGAATPAVSGETATGAPRGTSLETAASAEAASLPVAVHDVPGGTSVAGMALSLVPGPPPTVDAPRAPSSPREGAALRPYSVPDAGTGPPGHETASARLPDPLQPRVPGSGGTDVSVAVGSGAGIAILLAALAAGLLLAAPGLGRRLRPRLAPRPLPTLHLSLERPG